MPEQTVALKLARDFAAGEVPSIGADDVAAVLAAYDAVLAAGGRVEFVVDCPKCGEQASAGVTLFTDWVPAAPLIVDLEMAAAQMTFTCDGCGNECYTGDYDVYADEDGDDDA